MADSLDQFLNIVEDLKDGKDVRKQVMKMNSDIKQLLSDVRNIPGISISVEKLDDQLETKYKELVEINERLQSYVEKLKPV